VAEVRTGARVAAFDLATRTVTLASGERVRYREGLVASLPLPEMCRLAAIDGEGARLLRASAVTCVNLGLRHLAPAFVGPHWIYLPERRFRAYRVGFYGRLSEASAPAGREAVYVEIAHDPGADLQDPVTDAVADLIALGAIRDAGDVEVAVPVRIPIAYVIHDPNWETARERALTTLAARGVRMVGRYGRWEYASMEDALVQGGEAADAILRKR
jgi:hypothetical protein